MNHKGAWDPLKDLTAVQKRMNTLFESALARTDFETPGDPDSWTPVSDVYETADALVLCLELPGLEQDRIELKVDGDEMVVQGERQMEREREGEQFHRVERSYGKFSRRFPIPSNVDRDRAQATYRHGVLRVQLPKTESDRPRTVRVAID